MNPASCNSFLVGIDNNTKQKKMLKFICYYKKGHSLIDTYLVSFYQKKTKKIDTLVYNKIVF